MVNTLSSYKDIFTLISFYVNYKLLDSKLNRLSTLTSEIRSSFKNTGKPVKTNWRHGVKFTICCGLLRAKNLPFREDVSY